MSDLHICAPVAIRADPHHRVLPDPWFPSECCRPEERPTCEECGAYIHIDSRTFEWREYDESTCGFYDGWYIVGVHYKCKRCGFASKPKNPPEVVAEARKEVLG